MQEITGQLPKEIYRALAPGEPLPKCRRRVGTAFTIDSELLLQAHTSKMSAIEQLQADIEVAYANSAALMRITRDIAGEQEDRVGRCAPGARLQGGQVGAPLASAPVGKRLAQAEGARATAALLATRRQPT